jgi:growth hormone secretagogue receptor
MLYRQVMEVDTSNYLQSVTAFTAIDADIPDSSLAYVVKIIIYFVTVPIPPILIVAGLIGNFLSFHLMNQKKYQASTTCFYMRVMAVSDSLYIFGRMFQRYLLVMAPHLFKRKEINMPFCLYYKTSLEVGAHVSPWVLVVMNFDRFLALTWPLQAAIICTMRRARITVGCIYALGLGFAATQLFTTFQEQYKHWLCPYALPEHWVEIQGMAEAVYMAVLPIVSLVAFNIGIMVAVQRSKRDKTLKRSEISSRDSSITVATIALTITFVVFQLLSG